MTESNSPLRWADDEEDDDDDGEDGDEMLLPPPRLPLLSPPFRRCRRMKRSCRWRFLCAFCCAFCFAVLLLLLLLPLLSRRAASSCLSRRDW